MTVLIVCHAGANIGLGHLTRSLVVATALHERFKSNVSFLIQGESVVRPDLANFTHWFVSSISDLGQAIMESARSIKPWLVILDLHPMYVPTKMTEILNSLRSSGCRVVAIDGLLSYRDSLDLVFLPSLRCDDPLAQGEGSPVVFGLDCFLIPEYRRPQTWVPGRELLVLTGGADVTGLNAVLPGLIDATLPPETTPQWVHGPYANAPQIPQNPRLVWAVHQAPAGLRSQMTTANYALTLFGVSFFELLKMGVPTVVFSPYEKKDFADLQCVSNLGIAIVAKNERDAVRQLLKLMSNDKYARILSRRASASMAGSGGARLGEIVSNWRPD
jgi:spore coat polysaccharide biosynthesis predicted glycosyltransferase SpsG